jgi:hypothetical protein
MEYGGLIAGVDVQAVGCPSHIPSGVKPSVEDCNAAGQVRRQCTWQREQIRLCERPWTFEKLSGSWITVRVSEAFRLSSILWA